MTTGFLTSFPASGPASFGVDKRAVYAGGSIATPVAGFVFEINTNNVSAGSTAADHFALPLIATGTYDFNVDWGDGSDDDISAWDDAAKDHAYSSAGTYTITITGTIIGWRFNNTGDRLKMLNVSSWDQFTIGGTTDGVFFGCANLTSTASDQPGLAAGVTTLSNAFRDCSSFNQDLSDWDVSTVTNLFFTFFGAASFNQDLGGWDVSAVMHFTNFMQGANALSTANYDAILIGWEALDLVDSLSCHFGDATYSAGAAAAARANIIADDLWTITDGGPA